MKITGLEALRGLCAIIVAIYHPLAWSGYLLPSWGLYAVYIFFTISGAVLYVNYHNMQSAGRFLLARFARLAPLYVLVVMASAILNHQGPTFAHILNVSLLFGLFSPGATSTVVGGWSLGVEMVFYLLFPVLLLFMRSMKFAIGALVALLILRIALIETLLQGHTLVDAWTSYTQPGTFLCFFVGGMVLARLSPGPQWWPIALCAIALFAFPGSSQELILTGWRGALYSLLAIAAVGGFFWSGGGAISRLLGEVSYGLYLLHPLVWALVGRYMPAPLAAQIAVTIAIASTLALMASRLYERPVRKWMLSVPGWSQKS